MKKDETIYRAQKAAQIIDNPEFNRCFDSIRNDVISKMERIEIDGNNDAHAAKLVQKLQATVSFKAELVRLILRAENQVKREERKDQIIDPSSPKQRI